MGITVRRTISRLLAVLVALAVVFSTGVAFAITPPNAPPVPGAGGPHTPHALPLRRAVPDGVTVAGHDIGGMSEDQARSVMLAYVKPSAFLPNLTAKAAGTTFTLIATDVFYTDTDAMLDEAYAMSSPGAIGAKFGLNSNAAASFVTGIATKTDSKGSNARWVLSGKRMKLIPSSTARHTDCTTGRTLVLAALKRELGSGAAQAAVTIPVSQVAPRFTERQLGRVILVVLSERYLRLYDPGKGGYILHGYPCAVGMPQYPTPTGAWRIVLKRYMPTWVNPGDAWGAGMPAVIGPGPGNPLGTRAMNLNADGIRIHGTENINSIGTAASHGCIRLQRKNVEQLFDLVVVGTPVYIIK